MQLGLVGLCSSPTLLGPLTSLPQLAVTLAGELGAMAHCGLEACLAAVHQPTEARDVEGQPKLLVNEIHDGPAHLIAASVDQRNAIISARENASRAKKHGAEFPCVDEKDGALCNGRDSFALHTRRVPNT